MIANVPPVWGSVLWHAAQFDSSGALEKPAGGPAESILAFGASNKSPANPSIATPAMTAIFTFFVIISFLQIWHICYQKAPVQLKKRKMFIKRAVSLEK